MESDIVLELEEKINFLIERIENLQKEKEKLSKEIEKLQEENMGMRRLINGTEGKIKKIIEKIDLVNV